MAEFSPCSSQLVHISAHQRWRKIKIKKSGNLILQYIIRYRYHLKLVAILYSVEFQDVIKDMCGADIITLMRVLKKEDQHAPALLIYLRIPVTYPLHK
jgi:hypothetical protein